MSKTKNLTFYQNNFYKKIFSGNIEEVVEMATSLPQKMEFVALPIIKLPQQNMATQQNQFNYISNATSLTNQINNFHNLAKTSSTTNQFSTLQLKEVKYLLFAIEENEIPASFDFLQGNLYYSFSAIKNQNQSCDYDFFLFEEGEYLFFQEDLALKSNYNAAFSELESALIWNSLKKISCPFLRIINEEHSAFQWIVATEKSEKLF